MIQRIIHSFAQRLRGSDYQIDNKISTTELLSIIFSRLVQIIRGNSVKFLFKKCGSFLFLGKSTKLIGKNRIEAGFGISIGDRVYINAICKNGIVIGNNVTIRDDTVIDSGLINNIGDGLIIGNNVGISQKCFLQISGKLTIGNDVLIGPGVSIFTENHNISDHATLIRLQGVCRAGTTIENNVWIGSNSVVLAGVSIGAGAVVAAHSVVTKDVQCNTVVAGNPARLIKQR